MVEKVYKDIATVMFTVERHKKVIESLKEVAMHCNDIDTYEFNSYCLMSDKINEIAKDYDDILEELMSISRLNKEG